MSNEHIFYSSKDVSFHLEHARRIGSFNMPAFHYHNRFELYYLISGERNYFIRDRAYAISKGTLVLIGPNELHKTTEKEKATHERILIEFTPDYLNGFPLTSDLNLYSIFNDVHLLKLDGIQKTKIENLMHQLIQENKTKEPGYALAAKVILIELLIHISRCLSKVKKDAFAHPSQLHEKISEIIVYINSNYMLPLSLDALSSKFFISKFYLCREFKEITGFSFREYLNSIRAKEAMQRLLKTKLTISEIAGEVGYDSSTHFGRVFKMITGATPLQYRKMNL